MPTNQLLEKFGAGRHKPGSGGAAALLSLVACKLLQAVVDLTHGREQYDGVRDQSTLANKDLLSDIEPSLKHTFQEDSVQFDKVIRARRQRDAEEDPVRRRP